MLSQKSGYKLDFISTYLRLVIDAKKMVNMSNNRLLNNKKQVCWVNAESKKGIQSEFHFYIPSFVVEAKYLVDVITNWLLDNKWLVKIR